MKRIEVGADFVEVHPFGPNVILLRMSVVKGDGYRKNASVCLDDEQVRQLIVALLTEKEQQAR